MKKYLFIVLLLFVWGCEDDENVITNNCDEIVSNANEALSLWSGVLDDYMTNDEYPNDAREICDDYFDALVNMKESNCNIDLDGIENLSLAEIEDLRSTQCGILPQVSSLTFTQSTSCDPRYGASAVSHENDIYLIGGANGQVYYNTMSKLDEPNNVWTTLNDQVIGRRYLTAEVVNGIIYIIGGSNPNGFVDTVQAYDIANDNLYDVAPLPTKRTNLNSVVYQNKIYVIGGKLENSENRTNIVEVFDPLLNSWETLSPMPTSRECDIALFDNKIYAFGGFDGSNGLTNVEVYDIANDSWSSKSEMPYDLSAYHLASFDNFIFLIGDYDDYIDGVNLYNAIDETWNTLVTNFTGRRHAAVVRNNDWIYVIGGFDGSTVFDLVEKCKPF